MQVYSRNEMWNGKKRKMVKQQKMNNLFHKKKGTPISFYIYTNKEMTSNF